MRFWLWKTFSRCIVDITNEVVNTRGKDHIMHHALWQSVLGEIELSISHAAFTTWFKNTELIDNTGETVTIAVPNIFAKRQFEVKFNDQIKSILEKNGVSPHHITYTVKTNGKKTVTRETTTSANPRG